MIKKKGKCIMDKSEMIKRIDYCIEQIYILNKDIENLKRDLAKKRDK
jgi:hypothetical protein